MWVGKRSVNSVVGIWDSWGSNNMMMMVIWWKLGNWSTDWGVMPCSIRPDSASVGSSDEESKDEELKKIFKINCPKNCEIFKNFWNFYSLSFWLDLLKLSVENLKWIWYRTRALVYFYTLLRCSASKQVASNWEKNVSRWKSNYKWGKATNNNSEL